MPDPASLLVLINAKAGPPDPAREQLVDQIREHFRALGLSAEVRPTPGDGLTDAARRAVEAGTRTVVAAGGDGTVSAVAGALTGTGATLGVIPVGTLNHFAKDLSLPLETKAAIDCIAAGHTTEVDVAEVNGRCFINNSSIGLYPHMVAKRDKQMQRLGRGKWLAVVMATWATFHRHMNLRVRLDVVSGDRSLGSGERSTPFVFVGNNAYTMEFFNLGGRTALDRGELCLYVACRGGRLAMLALALRALFGRLEQSRDFASITAREIEIGTPKKTLRVSVDGEIIRMSPPLRYRIRPRSLRVIVPRA